MLAVLPHGIIFPGTFFLAAKVLLSSLLFTVVSQISVVGCSTDTCTES